MATMADVARHAGVAKQTVSNVLTGNVSVRSQTRERVFAAIEALGYRPNLVARELRKGKTSILAIMVPTIANPFYAEMVEEIERVIGENQYSLLLGTTRGDLEWTLTQLQMLADRSIGGLFLFEDRHITEALADTMAKDFPIVFCNWEREPYPDHFPVVGIDYRHAGYLAGQHLLEIGHQHAIAAIFEAPAHDLRLQGFQSALLTKGAVLLPELVIATQESTRRSGYQAALQLLERPTRPRAIFATNDLMALGAMDALRDRGLTIPNEVSVVGIDDIAQGAYAHPPLTTLAIQGREVAQDMARTMLRATTGEPQARTLTLHRPHLIVRCSTASPL